MLDNSDLSIYDDLLEGVQILDRDLRYIYINPSAAIHGKKSVKDLIGKKMVEAYPGIEETEIFVILKECLNEESEKFLENEFTYEDGSKGWFELRIRPHPKGILIFSSDRTPIKLQEKSDLSTEKLGALERLAAGIAHDFNNKLSIFELAFNSIMKNHEVDESIVNALKSNIDSSRQLIQTLSCYASPDISKERGVNITAFLKGLNSHYDILLGENIELIVGGKCEDCQVLLSKVHLDQIFLNLLVNAKYAMKDKGVIKIECIKEVVGPTMGMHPSGLEAGTYSHITVTDNGSGMSQEVINNAFRESYTTKPEDEGSGLGLYTTHMIVAQNGGKISISSKEGVGTTFEMWLKAK